MTNAKHLLLFGSLMLACPTFSQFNEKGTMHASLGIAAGGHATEYDRTAMFTVFGITFSNREVSTGAAATITYPIEFHYGLAPVFSLGAYYEPGLYIDSLDTRNNRLHLLGIQPRFYIVNKDRFAWLASLHLGTTSLRIEDNDIDNSESTFKGVHWGLGSGLIFLFSERVGLQVHFRYVATKLDLKEFRINDEVVASANYDGTLRTSGGTVKASLYFRF